MSCDGDESSEIPKNVIPEEKMIEVITEIELTQALIKLKFSVPDTTQGSAINKQELFNQVYKSFNTSEEQFNNSLTYYSEHPKLLMEMYIKVINNLSEKQGDYQ